MFSYCNFCFTPVGERITKYPCIINNKETELELSSCPDCDFFYDFHPKKIVSNSKENAINDFGIVINENKIKETFCYLCCNYNGEYTNLQWNEELIHLRMCVDCNKKLPLSEDKFVARGNSYEEALIFIKRSLLF